MARSSRSVRQAPRARASSRGAVPARSRRPREVSARWRGRRGRWRIGQRRQSLLRLNVTPAGCRDVGGEDCGSSGGSPLRGRTSGGPGPALRRPSRPRGRRRLRPAASCRRRRHPARSSVPPGRAAKTRGRWCGPRSARRRALPCPTARRPSRRRRGPTGRAGCRGRSGKPEPATGVTQRHRVLGIGPERRRTVNTRHQPDGATSGAATRRLRIRALRLPLTMIRRRSEPTWRAPCCPGPTVCLPSGGRRGLHPAGNGTCRRAPGHWPSATTSVTSPSMTASVSGPSD